MHAEAAWGWWVYPRAQRAWLTEDTRQSTNRIADGLPLTGFGAVAGSKSSETGSRSHFSKGMSCLLASIGPVKPDPEPAMASQTITSLYYAPVFIWDSVNHA